jgi:catechol 2,3-dioxygenase-like lactoylglutathione lyase family enzyme
MTKLFLLFALTATTLTAFAQTEFSKGNIDIGIVVRDADRTAAFLTNAIGMAEVKGFSVSPEMGRKIGLVDGYPVDVRMFSLGAEPCAKIKVLSVPKAKTADQKFIHSTLGIRYLTLYVKDLTPAVERIKAAKVKFLGETPYDLGGGNYLAVVQDPDGNFLELIGPMKK